MAHNSWLVFSKQETQTIMLTVKIMPIRWHQMVKILWTLIIKKWWHRYFLLSTSKSETQDLLNNLLNYEWTSNLKNSFGDFICSSYSGIINLLLCLLCRYFFYQLTHTRYLMWYCHTVYLCLMSPTNTLSFWDETGNKENCLYLNNNKWIWINYLFFLVEISL